MASELVRRANSNKKSVYSDSLITTIDFRPFRRFYFYNDPAFISMNFRQQHYFPIGTKNLAVVFPGVGASKAFSISAVDNIVEHDFIEKSQAAPRYRYTPDGERIDNITDWGLKQFQKAYGKDGLISPLVGEMARRVRGG